MTTFKVLHTADICLNSSRRGVSRYKEVPVDPGMHGDRAALDNLIDGEGGDCPRP